MSERLGDIKGAVAIGPAPTHEITVLVNSLQRAFPVASDHDFAAILREIDVAEEASHEQPK